MQFLEAVKEGGGVMVRRIYVQVAGDLVSGALLSQIAYWNAPSVKTGKSKLRVERGGRLWLAKTREEIAAEACMTIAQYRRAVAVLKEKKLIETEIRVFAGITRVHFFLDLERLAQLSAPFLESAKANKQSIH